MIYDCFTFFNELDLLELRLNILNDSVDKFVIVEASKTFTGVEKPLHFEGNKERFKKFEDKIIHIIVNDFPETKTDWTFENIQRNAISQGLQSCQDEDVILISDVDEIIAPDAIIRAVSQIGTGTPIKTFVQYNMCYYMNVLKLDAPLWYHPQACSYKNFKECLDNIDYNYTQYVPESLNHGTTANKVRMHSDTDLIPFGGWHFSFLGGEEKVRLKIESFSHQECRPHLNGILHDTARRLKIVNNSNADTHYRAINDNILPQYLIENKETYSSYISKTLETKLSGFSEVFDYSEEKKKFEKYRILSFFSIGKSRKRYARKYKDFKRRIRNIEENYV